MDNVSLPEINGIWKMLNEMATTDPVGYQKFIDEQMKRGPELLSQPECKGVLKCTLKERCSLFINICEWEFIDKPKSETAPVPFYCGSIYNIDNAKVVCVAMHPTVFVQYKSPQVLSKSNADINQLFTLIILFIKHEKNIQTVEWDGINAQNLIEFDSTWGSEPYGGESEMFKSLHYEKFSLADIPKKILTSYEDMPTFGDVPTNIEPKIKLPVIKSDGNSKLIQEVRVNPYWQLTEHSKRPNTCEYKITLPIGLKIGNCELDISKVGVDKSLVSSSQTTLSLRIKNNSEYREAFCAQFEKPINILLAKAQFNKTRRCLSVTAPFL